jgi:hypothetical protein
MHRRFRFISSTLGIVASAFLVFACTLQTTGLGPAELESADAATHVTHDASSAVAPDAAADDAGDEADDAAASIDAADVQVAYDGAAADPCDEDRDGHRAMGCGGDDCCDFDHDAHPGQTAYFAGPSACGTFDYDCDGRVDPEVGIASCALGFFACSGDGFASTTACGVLSHFTTCSWAGFSCNHTDGMRTQRCR